MSKLVSNLLIFVWFILILGITTSLLGNGNRAVYYIVTISLLVIPTEIFRRWVKKKNKH